MLKLFVSTFLVFGLFSHQMANAKPAAPVSPLWIDVPFASSQFSITGAGQSTPSTVTFSSTSSADQIWYYNDNITPQDPLSIKGVVETQFNLVAGSLDLVGNGESASFSNVASFDYLAVHFGRGELLFHWLAPQTSFSISGLPRGFSNYRTYSSNVSAVPEPETYGMMLVGLSLMGFAVRRRKSKQ
jgi:hypothetical protein